MNINYRAVAIILWYQDGNRDKFDDADESLTDYYLDRALQVVNAALGDTVLYKKVYRQPTLADIETIKFVQVWPKGDNE